MLELNHFPHQGPFVLDFFKKKNLFFIWKNHFFIFVVFVLDFLKIHFVKKKNHF